MYPVIGGAFQDTSVLRSNLENGSTPMIGRISHHRAVYTAVRSERQNYVALFYLGYRYDLRPIRDIIYTILCICQAVHEYLC